VVLLVLLVSLSLLSLMLTVLLFALGTRVAKYTDRGNESGPSR
jgi:hypothetical protein